MIKIFCLLFLLMNISFCLKAQKKDTQATLLLGKWEYNIAYDTIGVVVDTADFYKPFNEREKKIFLTDFKIKERTARLTDFPEKLNAKWELKGEDELYFYLKDKRILKYIITKLNSDTLELRDPDKKNSSLGYFKR